MNTATDSPAAKRPPWNRHDCVYLSIVGLPILTLVGMLLAAGLSWSEHSRQVDSDWNLAVAQDANSGKVNESTLAHWYDARGSKANTATLNHVSIASEAIARRIAVLLPDLNLSEASFVAPPGEPLPLQRLIDHVAIESTAIVSSMTQLAESDEMVWQPLVFEGRSTRLPSVEQSRNVAMILNIEFMHSFHQGETDRAINALRLMSHFFGPEYRSSFVLEELARGRHFRTAQDSVRQSLAFDVWSPAELAALQELMSVQFNWDARWKDVVRGDLLQTYPWVFDRETLHELTWSPSINRDFGLISRMVDITTAAPSLQRGVAQSYAVMRAQRQAGTQAHFSAIRKLDAARVNAGDWSADRWLQFPVARGEWYAQMFPALLPMCAGNFAVWANEQRWTRTAIAIKQFAVEHDRLPDALAELTSVGLPAEATLDFNGEPFRYSRYRMKNEDVAELMRSASVGTGGELARDGYFKTEAVVISK